MIFSHRVTPLFAVVVGCLIPVPGAAVTFVLWCTCCSFFSGRPTLHSASQYGDEFFLRSWQLCSATQEIPIILWNLKVEAGMVETSVLRSRQGIRKGGTSAWSCVISSYWRIVDACKNPVGYKGKIVALSLYKNWTSIYGLSGIHIYGLHHTVPWLPHVYFNCNSCYNVNIYNVWACSKKCKIAMSASSIVCASYPPLPSALTCTKLPA
jgi:hypothetical protein